MITNYDNDIKRFQVTNEPDRTIRSVAVMALDMIMHPPVYDDTHYMQYW